MENESLYEKALKITQRNESLYDRWESPIAAYMGKRWPEGFALAQEITGAELPTAMEMADMGAEAISDEDEFLSDLYDVFRTLAKGCALDISGNWCSF